MPLFEKDTSTITKKNKWQKEDQDMPFCKV
jgi:hypothetical protein